MTSSLSTSTAPTSSAPDTTAQPPSRATDPPSRRFTVGRLYLALAFAAILIAALSLLLPSTPSYDPWSWLIWGRQIIHLDLQTTGGPTWKPLTVLLATIFAPFGRAQPDLLLVADRAGAAMAVLMSFRISWRILRPLVSERLGTEAAGLALLPAALGATVAAASLINSPAFITDNALGYSEGLMAALVLIALDRHLDGSRRQALVIGFFATLDRPELWILWGAYAIYLWWADPAARRLVIGMAVLVLALWFLPSQWGAGNLLAWIERAQHPRSNSPAFAKCPICTEFVHHAWPRVMFRVKAVGLLALAVAALGLWRMRTAWWRARTIPRAAHARLLLLAVGGIGWLWWLGVSIETQMGFSGNDRYLVLGTALIAISGGVGWGWGAAALAGWLRRADLRGWLRRRRTASATALTGSALALAVGLGVPPWIGPSLLDVPATHRALVYQAHLREDVQAAINSLGGAKRVLACGTVMTEGFQVPMVAWYLDVKILRVEAQPSTLVRTGRWPNVILQARDTRSAALLPLPAQIIAWEHEGAHYTFHRFRTFFVFSDCAGQARS